jgi:hypothetical protein
MKSPSGLGEGRKIRQKVERSNSPRDKKQIEADCRIRQRLIRNDIH